MLFYNTILKTIQVSTSYNSYFGLMRQMYKKNIFPAKKKRDFIQKERQSKKFS